MRWCKDDILNFLSEHAREAPFGKCMEIAITLETLAEENRMLKTALAVLSEEVIGLSSSGYLSDDLKSRDLRPCVKWALEQVLNIHAGIVCGASPGMKNFLKEVDDMVLDPKNKTFSLYMLDSYWKEEKDEVH